MLQEMLQEMLLELLQEMLQEMLLELLQEMLQEMLHEVHVKAMLQECHFLSPATGVPLDLCLKRAGVISIHCNTFCAQA